mmetsp:Transcript_77437/g.121925  ORF Transcript_77437/g.121925 Transcript_77437/m.121925 type:complete len:121 (-) Transcript_77437:31-393(-)
MPNSMTQGVRDEQEGFEQSHGAYATGVLCLLTIMLAGLLLCTLHTFGIVASADTSRCPQDFLGRYAGCQARQDIKALLSFVLGTLVIVATPGPWSPEPSSSTELGMRDTLLKLERCGVLL